MFSIFISTTAFTSEAESDKSTGVSQPAATTGLTAPALNGTNWINLTNNDFVQTFNVLPGSNAVINGNLLLSFSYGGTFPSSVNGFPVTKVITLCSSIAGCVNVTPAFGQSGSNIPIPNWGGTSAHATFKLTTRLNTSSRSRQPIPGITASMQILQVPYGDGAPALGTSTASVTSSGATFDSAVFANRYVTSAYFRYGTTNTSSCSSLPAVTPSINLIPPFAYNFPISAAVAPLASGVRYYFCAVASNTFGTTFGTVRNFVVPVPNYSALFEFGQANFPQEFPAGDGAVNQLSAPYVFRYYPSTQNYLGICTQTGAGACPPQSNGAPVPTNGRSVYVLGPFGVALGAPSLGAPIYVGEVENFGNFRRPTSAK